MAKKILQIVEAAYRGTLEEQDDTIVWLTHMLRDAGADVDLLLRGSAVNYAAPGQDAGGLAFGGAGNRHAPDLSGDLARLAGTGAHVYVVAEDVAERGLSGEGLLDGVEAVSRGGLPALFRGYAQVHAW